MKIYVDEMPKNCNNCPCKAYEQRIAELEEENKQIEHFKENNGYNEWDTIDLLEDLQSTALQAEDDSDVVRDLLTIFKINDENKIVEKIKALQEENAKLQEQLKNALQDIQNFIERKITASKKASQEYIDGYCACGCDVNDYIEDEIKAEAQKYLEERK